MKSPFDHDLLKNWFRLHWRHQESGIPSLSFEDRSVKDQTLGMNLLPRLDIAGGQPGSTAKVMYLCHKT
jgi:hypothetical protein